MRSKYQILHDDRGLSAVEFALTAPVFLGLLLGVTQLGPLFFANTGLKSAVAEGARHAMLFPTPTNAQIAQKITDSRFGLPATVVPTVTSGIDADRPYVDIQMSYTVPLDFLLYRTNSTLTETRRVFVHKNTTPAPTATPTPGGTPTPTPGGTPTPTVPPQCIKANGSIKKNCP